MTQGPTIVLGTGMGPPHLYYIDTDGLHKSLTAGEVFNCERSVVFGGPAPFSRLDTEQAMAYEQFCQEFFDLGVKQVVGLYCQDAFVMQQFQKHVAEKAGTNQVKYFGDGDGFFATFYGLAVDFSYQGLGIRSKRWCAVIEFGTVQFVEFDEYQLIENTRPERVLEWLRKSN